MAQGEITTVTGPKDKALVALALLFGLGGAVAYQVFSSEDFFIRLALVLGGVVAAAVTFFVSPVGRRFVSFSKASVEEAKLVVWPERKEAIQMTVVVFVFVLVMSIFLLATDSILEWVFYDLILGWVS